MADMVKELAVDKPSTKAPAIAMEVWTHYEAKFKGYTVLQKKYL